MIAPRCTLPALAILLGVVLATTSALAFPGVLIAKGSEPRSIHSTHVIIMMKENIGVVTVMPDYDGPQTPFALLMPVPADVTLDRVKTMKREYIGRVEELTAPRYHEFYEKDPCESGEAQQEWERDLRVKTTGFLGGNQELSAPKVAPEFSLNFDTKYKDSEGEYTYSMIGGDEEGEGGKVYAGLDDFLNETGFELKGDARRALTRYQQRGMKILAAVVDPKMMELVAGGRGQLAGIHYWSAQPVTTIPSTLGLANSPGKQDLFVYVLHPDQRWEPKNYKYVYPPTNIELKFVIKQKGKERFVKERTGEVYNAIHDLIAEKNPQAFLYEFAWDTSGCGQPCPNEKLLYNELLTLGGIVFEDQLVSDEDKHPEPPEESEEDKKKFEEDLKAKELKPPEVKKAKKQHEEDRKELARRKALISRQHYVISRFHYRYDKSTLPRDVEIRASKHQIQGGVDIPKGPKPTISTKVEEITKPGKYSRFQARYNHYFKWDGEVKCEQPERWRWGKRWRHRRVWNKIWLALDLAHRRRNEIDPKEVVLTPLPELGINPVAEQPVADAGVEVPAPEKKSKGCGCQLPGQADGAGGGAAGLALLGLVLARRRRRRVVS